MPQVVVHGPSPAAVLAAAARELGVATPPPWPPGRRVVSLGTDAAGRRVHAVASRRCGPVYARSLAWLLAVAGQQGRVELVPAPSGGPVPAARAPGVVLYYCYAGVHTSVLAGALHLRILPPRGATAADILSLPAFDRFTRRRFGDPYVLGRDEQGRLVACVGLGLFRRTVATLLLETMEVLGLAGGVRLVPTLEWAGPLLRLGGWCSQRLRLVRLGRALILHDLLARYPGFVARVARERGAARPSPS